MKNLKKVLALVLVVATLMSFATVASAAFTDADKVSKTEAVDVMSELGVIKGYTDGSFRPEGDVTRAEMAKMVTIMISGGEDVGNLYTGANTFSDCTSHWAKGYIAYANKMGIVAGVGGGKFNPNGSVTGAQAAKMMLVALGYKSDIEQYTGSQWSVNVLADARSAGILEGLDGVNMNAALSREDAAQMMFNTLTAVMVEYKGGTNITTSDGTTVVVDAERYYVGHAVDSGYKFVADTNDQYMQFCEQYFSKLKLNTSSHDDMDRPSNEWIYANKSVGAYAQTPAVTYTAFMNNDSGKKTVSSDLKNYYYGGTSDGSKVKSAGNVTPVDNIDTSDEVAALTENGRAVEIYVTDNVITDIVCIDSKLAEIKKITDDEVTFSGSGLSSVKVEKDDELYSFFAGMKKDDKVVLVVDSDKVLEAYKPETVTGKFTKTKGTGETTEYTVGGTVYQKNTSDTVAGLSDGNLNNTYTLTLDKYGYILAVGDEEVADDVYAYVMDASANVNRGEYDYALKLLFADGTIEWVDVAEVNDDVVADGDVTTEALNDLKENFVSYTKGTDGYSVTSESAKTDAAAYGEIAKGTSEIFDGHGDYTASNKTVFLVKDGSSYTVYTGIKNVPSMSVADGDAVVLKDGSVAVIVVIDKNASTSNEDQVFIYSTTVQGTEKDGTTTIKYYKAIVNGEDTTIGISDTTFNGTPATGLYVNNSYTKEYISDMGDKYDAAASDTTAVKVHNVTNDTLADLMLKNGILTVDQTTDATYVMADEFESWIVKGTSAEVDTLALDSTSTKTSEGITINSGDYVVIVLDGDGYVTDLYLVDANA